METSLVSVICVPIIVTVVYVVMAVYKHVVADRGELLTRLIPVWAMILGAILGVYIFYKVPSIMIADNVVSALLVGLVSGLSAVGFNQIGKQLTETSDETTTTKTTTTTATTTTTTTVGAEEAEAEETETEE